MCVRVLYTEFIRNICRKLEEGVYGRNREKTPHKSDFDIDSIEI